MGLFANPLSTTGTVVPSSVQPQNKKSLWIDNSGLIPALKVYNSNTEAWEEYSSGSESNTVIVANITERDALQAKEGMSVLVIDGTGDLSVSTGWSSYLYTSSSWLKTGEGESLDISSGGTIDSISANNVIETTEKQFVTSTEKAKITTNETAITGQETRIIGLETDSHTHANKTLLDTYTATNTDINDAINIKHSHTNKVSLDKVSEDVGGKFTYNGVTYATKTELDNAVLAGGGSSKPYEQGNYGTTYTYNADGKIETATMSGDVSRVTTYTYGTVGVELGKIVTQVIEEGTTRMIYTYTYDPSGKISNIATVEEII